MVTFNEKYIYSVSPDFNIEIFVQIIYDKELIGRQLHRDGIDNITLQKWFIEWNELQPQLSSAIVTNDIIEQKKKRNGTSTSWYWSWRM